MKPEKPTPQRDTSEEISALIETLHRTGQRLEELTAGEVDTVADRDGRTFMLRHAQEQQRSNEAAKQAAILNALPAHIALLDAEGKIISVSEAWRRFADANALQCAEYGIGVNYLAICDNARGDDATAAHQAAAGIRSALAGTANSFSLEYPCHSPGEQRWFQMTVTPLAADRPQGVVIMHVNITEFEAAKAKIRRQTKLYAALSECNKTIVYSASEAELFPQICRAAVEFGGMKIAWIGITDSETQMVRPAASSGDDSGLLENFDISVDANSPFGHGPTGTAIRDGHTYWCQDFLNDPFVAPWRERLVRHNLAASASLPLYRNGVVFGAFILYSSKANPFDEAARNLLVEMASDISFALDNFAHESQRKQAEEAIQHHVRQLKTAFMSTVEVATTLSGLRDPYTAGHERRVAEIAVAISVGLGFDEGRQEGLMVAGFLHDIGKITIPAEILSKPGKLSALEYQMIQEHAQAGYDVLKDVEFPWPVAQIALQHHERIDGSGYPQGLKGEAILFEARILAVADVIEAMASHRPYRAGLGIDKALAEIERGRGSAYDPVVVDTCLELFREKGYAIPV